jgi:hypothetical protein
MEPRAVQGDALAAMIELEECVGLALEDGTATGLSRSGGQQ